MDELEIGLVTGGWVASIVNLVSATLGIACGLLSDKVGARRIVAGGVIMLIIGALAGGFATNGATLIVTRAMVVAPYLLETVGWRGFWFANAALMSAFLVWFVIATTTKRWEGVPRPQHQRTLREVLQIFRLPGPWLLGAVFDCYSIQFFAMMAWLPTFLIETQGQSALTASLIAALVVAANMIGNLGAAWLLHHHTPRWALQMTALVVMGICAIGVFGDLLPASIKLALAFVFSAVGGMLPAATLAASAAHAPTRDQVATVNGFIVQGSNTGGLAGPPVMAAVVGYFGGWSGSEWFMVACGTVGILLAFGLRYIETHPITNPPTANKILSRRLGGD